MLRSTRSESLFYGALTFCCPHARALLAGFDLLVTTLGWLSKDALELHFEASQLWSSVERAPS